MSIVTSNDELYTVREAMRGLNQIVTRIEDGEIDKAVLMRHGKMCAVVLPIGAVDAAPDRELIKALQRIEAYEEQVLGPPPYDEMRRIAREALRIGYPRSDELPAQGEPMPGRSGCPHCAGGTCVTPVNCGLRDAP